TFHRLARVEDQGFDEPAAGGQPDISDLSFDAADALRLRDTAQELAVCRGVEMVGIVQRRAAPALELSSIRRLELEAVVAQFARDSAGAGLEPHVLEIGHPGRGARHAERVEIAVSDPR